jgi:signal transduction histidine kinase
MKNSINKRQITKIEEYLNAARGLLDTLDLCEGQKKKGIVLENFPGFVLTLQKTDSTYDITAIKGDLHHYFPSETDFTFDLIDKYINEKDYVIFQKDLEEAFANNKKIRGDFRFVSEDKKLQKWFEIIFSPNPKQHSLNLIFIENTERKEIEEQERLLQEMDKSSSLKSLVSCIAHEVNNPNHNIMQNISLLENGWPDIIAVLDKYYEAHGDFNIKNVQYSKVRDYLASLLEKILNSSRQIKDIIDDLRNFSQKTQNLLSDQINLNFLVKKTVDLLRQQINNATINFQEIYASETRPILGNFNQLQQVIINLLHNSFNAIEDSTKSIKIFTFYNAAENVVGVGVSDEGCGISDEKLHHIFNHFHSLKNGKNGGGLGLPISKEIIDLHNGEISIDTKPGKGTTVVFKLPVKVGRK